MPAKQKILGLNRLLPLHKPKSTVFGRHWQSRDSADVRNGSGLAENESDIEMRRQGKIKNNRKT